MSAVVTALALVSAIPAAASAAEWKINGSPVTTSTAVTWKGSFSIYMQGAGLKAKVTCEDNSTGTIGAKGANETKMSFSNCVNEENCPKPATLTASEPWKASLLTVSGNVWDGMRAEGESGRSDEVTLHCEGGFFDATCTVSNPKMTNSSPNVLATFSFKEGEGSIKNCGSSGYASYYTGAQTIALTKGGVLQVSP